MDGTQARSGSPRHSSSEVASALDALEPRPSETSGYISAPREKTAQRADAGNPSKALVSALGLEPRPIGLKVRGSACRLQVGVTSDADPVRSSMDALRGSRPGGTAFVRLTTPSQCNLLCLLSAFSLCPAALARTTPERRLTQEQKGLPQASPRHLASPWSKGLPR